MIPPSGSINIIGNSGTLPSTVLSGNVAYAFSNDTSRAPTELIVLGSTTGGGALAATLSPIRVSPFTFIRGLSASGIPDGARIIAKESPVRYTVTAFAWNTDVLTITINPALPVATVTGQVVTVTGSSVGVLNGTYTARNASTNSVEVDLVGNPGNLSGITGFIKPGIVDTAPNGSNAGGRGYYTLNMPVTAVSTGTTPGTSLWTTQVVPAGTTHVIAYAGTGVLGDLWLDQVGRVTMPCQQVLALRNLKGGTVFVADGSTANVDITQLLYVSYNPLGNS